MSPQVQRLTSQLSPKLSRPPPCALACETQSRDSKNRLLPGKPVLGPSASDISSLSPLCSRFGLMTVPSPAGQGLRVRNELLSPTGGPESRHTFSASRPALSLWHASCGTLKHWRIILNWGSKCLGRRCHLPGPVSSHMLPGRSRTSSHLDHSNRLLADPSGPACRCRPSCRQLSYSSCSMSAHIKHLPGSEDPTGSH